MSALSQIVRALAEAGATPDMLVAAVEAHEQAQEAAISSRRAKDAERQRRARERREVRQGHVTSRDVTVTPCDPSLDRKVPQTPPKINPIQEPPIAPHDESPPAEVNRLADKLWALANDDGRNRSGKPAVRKAVAAALARGAKPDQLEADVRAYYADASKADRDERGRTFAKGLHRRIEGDHWVEIRPPDPRPPPDPTILARRAQHLRDTGEWRPEWGPRPTPEAAAA